MNLLEQAVRHENVNIQANETFDLFVLKYNSLSVNWDEELLQTCRGIIVDRMGNVVAHPFNKFFNYMQLQGNESLSQETKAMSLWRDEPIVVMDKLDGSMITVFENPFELEVNFASSGSMNTEASNRAENYARNNWDESQYAGVHELTKKYTLIFEHTSLESIQVIPYQHEALTLIGARSKETGKLVNYNVLCELAEQAWIPVVQAFSLNTLEEVLEYVKTTKGIEGVIVQFQESGELLKLKTEEYLSKHHLLTMFNGEGNLSEKYIKEMISKIVSGQTLELDDLFAYYRQFNVPKLNQKLSALESLIQAIYGYLEGMNEYDVKINEWLPLVPEHMFRQNRQEYYNSTYLLELGEYNVPTWFAVSVAHQYEVFTKKQKEFLAIIEAMRTVNNSETGKAVAAVRAHAGEYGKYETIIAPKSFVFQQFNVEEVLTNVALATLKEIEVNSEDAIH